MGQGGHRRITSLTAVDLDPNGIVPAWTMVWMKPKMSAAPLSQSAPKSQALQTTPANACSAASAEIDCVKKRDPRGDETKGTEIKRKWSIILMPDLRRRHERLVK